MNTKTVPHEDTKHHEPHEAGVVRKSLRDLRFLRGFVMIVLIASTTIAALGQNGGLDPA